MSTDEALSALHNSLAAMHDAMAQDNGEGHAETSADALVAFNELDRMLTAGEPLPTAWAAHQRIEIVHARPLDWPCQVAVFVGGNELMTEDRTYSYVSVDPGSDDGRTAEQWQAGADRATDPMHGHSPAYAAMIRQAYKDNAPK